MSRIDRKVDLELRVHGKCLHLVIFGHMFGWKYAGYSILFQFHFHKDDHLHFHHRYDRVTLQITTEKAEEIMKKYVSQYHHGISCVNDSAVTATKRCICSTP